MATTTTNYPVTTLPFIVNRESLDRHPGRVIDWASVPNSYIPTGGTKKQLRAGLVIGEKNGRFLPCAVSATATSLVVATNVATVTLTAHGFAVGDVVTVAGSNLSYANISATIATVADANTFTYAATGSNATATGTITVRPSARYILQTPAQQDGPDAVTGHGAYLAGWFYENLLPDATGSPLVLPAAYKTELGSRFGFLAYSDTATN